MTSEAGENQDSADLESLRRQLDIPPELLTSLSPPDIAADIKPRQTGNHPGVVEQGGTK